jgi:hypothetical protein
MTFAIDNYYELLALHRTIMEAKFSADPNDSCIQGSPFVAAVANRVVEALIEMETHREGESAVAKWHDWRHISPERREYQMVESTLQSNPFWKTLGSAEQIKYVEDLVSPLQISHELIHQLITGK